ncbi:hypothetical protein R1sor_012312 [Riccia sorocarpa]|uniref:Uncharacterized protein n=1 Tax=Riccia sorocarpa TaxID=122646 RepID=A0ABD3I4N4_9MARC
MFRDGEAERKAYKERRRELLRKGCEEPDPWYGLTATDVTFAMRPAVPKHSNQVAVQCCNSPATETASQLVCRPKNSQPQVGYYHGKHDTDVTAHMQIPVPTFVNPHGCGPQACTVKMKRESGLDRAYDYMHPLGTHRPFPLTDVYFHRGPNPLGPCENQSPSPSCRPRSRSPGRSSPRPRSRSPGGTRRHRSRSPGGTRRSRSQSPVTEHMQKPHPTFVNSLGGGPHPCAEKTSRENDVHVGINLLLQIVSLRLTLPAAEAQDLDLAVLEKGRDLDLVALAETGPDQDLALLDTMPLTHHLPITCLLPTLFQRNIWRVEIGAS